MAKRSRRERRQEVDSRRVPTPNVTSPVIGDFQDIPADPATSMDPSTPVASRKVVNFAQEYYHVYVELRNIIIISIFLFGVMWALQVLV